MSKNRDLVDAILQAVGGKENVNSVIHCMTRLRFKLKDETVINLDGIKKIKGVLGAQFAENSFHIIIGPTVSDVYKELVVVADLENHDAIQENLDKVKTVHSKKITPLNVISNVFSTFASCMTPIIPIFVLMGMANVVAALIGPSFLNLVSEESHLYTNFYNVYQSILYFFPILLAVSASKVFKGNVWLGLVMASLMLYPDMITALGAEGGYTVLGISAPNVTYSGQVIPIILVIWIMSYVEKFVNRIIPNALKVIGVPLVTITIMLPLQFCLLGPLGTNIGTMLGNFLMWLYNTAGIVETTLMGAICIFTVAFGFGRPIFFICLGVLTTTGVEYVYLPTAIVIVNFVAMGIAAGYIVKAKTGEARETGISCLVSAFLGGVSEPTIFGIIMAKKTYIPCVIGGAVGGLIVGLFNVGLYQFGPSNFMSVIGFVSEANPTNFVAGCAAAIIAFVVTFVSMLFFYKDDSANN